MARTGWGISSLVALQYLPVPCHPTTTAKRRHTFMSASVWVADLARREHLYQLTYIEVIFGTRLTQAASFFVKIDSAILREVLLSGEVTRNTDIAVPVSAAVLPGRLGISEEAMLNDLMGVSLQLITGGVAFRRLID